MTSADRGKTMEGQVYALLREAIMTGRFQPGQLLSLRGVAKAVGSSTMPVRVALNILQAEGALVNGPGRALMVPPMTAELLEELRDVRIALEGCVTERAAAHMTPEALDELQLLLDEMTRHIESSDVGGYLRANFAFHTAIYRRGASAVTLSNIQAFWLRVGPFVNLLVPNVSHMERSMTSHRKIVEALARSDGKGARAAIEEDIREAARDLKEQLIASAV